MFELCGKMLEPCGKMLKQCDPQNVRRVYLSSPRLRTHESGKRMYVGLAIIAPFFTGFHLHSLRGVRFHCTFLYAHHRLHPECVRPLLQIGATRQLPEDASLAIKTTFIAFTQTLHSHYPLVCKQRERSPSSLYLDVSIVWTARRIRFVLFVRTILQTATILQQAADVPRQ